MLKEEVCQNCGKIVQHEDNVAFRFCPYCGYKAVSKTSQKGRDLKCRLSLTAKEAALGTTKLIRVNREDSCKGCNGSGKYPFYKGQELTFLTCSYCGGKGSVPAFKDITVRIPAGVRTGGVLSLKGEGESGMKDGANGDLLIEIMVY